METTQDVLNRIDERAETLEIDPNVWTSSSGVKFKLKRISMFLIKDITDQIPEPKTPTWFNEDKGRTEENPNDPDYKAAVDKITYKKSMTALEAICMLGTDIISLPPDMESPESDGWVEGLKELGIEVPDRKRPRYLHWVKYTGVLSESEMAELCAQVVRLSGGTVEADVQQATEDSFRPTETRDSA